MYVHTLLICRTLELNSLLYFGGLEPHITHDNIFSTTYDGCIADVKLGGQLLDFAQPEREQGTSIGCPPLEGSCSRICPRDEECVKLWDGSVCNCDGDSCVGGKRVAIVTNAPSIIIPTNYHMLDLYNVLFRSI